MKLFYHPDAQWAKNKINDMFTILKNVCHDMLKCLYHLLCFSWGFVLKCCCKSDFPLPLQSWTKKISWRGGHVNVILLKYGHIGPQGGRGKITSATTF